MEFESINSEDDIETIINHIRKGDSDILPEDSSEVTDDGLKLQNDELFYKSSGSCLNCFECGKEIVSGCKYEYEEYAYCDVCDIKYTREREPIVQTRIKHNSGFMETRKTIDRLLDNKYTCQECGNTHEYTKPTGGWIQSETYLHSYEGISLNCVCGKMISIGSKLYANEYECPKCGREHNIID